MKKFQDNMIEQPLILLVTDDAAAREKLSRFLQKNHYRTIEADNNINIIEVLQDQCPDCIYFDIISSEVDVFKTCEQVKRTKKNTDIPLMIGISGGEDSIIDLCFDMDADDYIIRPVQCTPGFLMILDKRIKLLIKRKQSEKDMERQQKLLETIVNSVPDIICLKDGQGRWLLTNDFNLDFFQLQGVDYKGKTDAELGEISRFYRDAFLTCMDTDQLAWDYRAPRRSEEIIPRPDGTLRVFDIVKIPLFNGDGSRHALVVTGRDITDRIKAEKERETSARKLRRARKMEAMGLMAGGVAHDLNNILSGLVSYPELLLLELPQDDALRHYVEAMQEAGRQAAEVVADLLTVARGAAGVRITADLNTLVNEYLGSIEFNESKRRHGGISVSVDLAPGLLNIDCSPVHIKKCLMNLMTNSIESIADNGTIAISTRGQYVDVPLEGHPDMKPGKYAVLSVMDSGGGISENDLDHIFEPFYSKKVMDRSGSGLGLTVVWNTVQDHHGGITVESAEQGTVFELYFPISKANVSTGPDRIRIDELRGRGEKILIVDDEQLQLEITGKVLETLGYEGAGVKSGREAINYLKHNRVELVILDMIMEPGMNGRKTYEQIIKMHPGQKALIVSGFSENEEVKKAQELGAVAFIKKPYTLTEMGFAIKNVLRADS